jgi:nucleotide-binding universal stress UspA family protein
MYGSVTERVIKTVHTPIIVVPPEGGQIPSSIVMAYDFSAPGKRAAEVARAIHGVCHGPLHMVHSYLDVWGEYTDRGAVVGEAAEKRREALHRGLEDMLQSDAKELFSIDAQTIQTHLVTGDPAEGVLRVADDVGATLICAGTTGKSGIERLLIGSVARRLLHDSKVPLLLTHDDAP